MEVEVSYVNSEEEHDRKLMTADVEYFRNLVSQYKPDIESVGDEMEILIAMMDYFVLDDTPNLEGQKTKRIIQEALVVEYWEEFFKSNNVCSVHRQIREGLTNKTKDIQIGGLSSYEAFKMWMDDFFSHSSYTYQSHIMKTLYFAKFHHCSNSPHKLNILFYKPVDEEVVVSTYLHIISTSCPDGVVLNSSVCMPEYMTDRLWINTEMNMVQCLSDFVADNYKEMTTTNHPMTYSYVYNGNGDRAIKSVEYTGNISSLSSTSRDLKNIDPLIISRFIVLPAYMGSKFPKAVRYGYRAQDCNIITYIDDNTDLSLNILYEITYEHKVLHSICYLVQGMLNKEVIKIDGNGARVYLHQILDGMQRHDPDVVTTDIRKREQVFEMCKCICLSYAVWYGTFSTETRHLQYDPITGDFIGLNPRVLLYGILPRLVITKEMVDDAVFLLSGMWPPW